MKLGLIQNKDQGSVEENLTETLKQIDLCSENGANVICTQELFLSHYFCNTQDDKNFDLAIKLNDPIVGEFQKSAKKNGVVIVASLFEEAMTGLYYNTSVIIDADGSILGKYRKNHIPQDPYFEEKFYFAPGDSGYPVWETKFGKLGVLICWDQWYPEAARMLALQGAEVILIPTAIGWLPEEKEEFGKQQFTAWQEVQRGHAVANGCYLAAVNRVGKENPIEFWGQSFVSNFAGEIIAQGSESTCENLIVDCDLNALEDHRRIWPFFRDRRTDTYSQITSRQING